MRCLGAAQGTRVPLLISVPWEAEGAVARNESTIVELVDMYATMADLLGQVPDASYKGTDGQGTGRVAI